MNIISTAAVAAALLVPDALATQLGAAPQAAAAPAPAAPVSAPVATIAAPAAASILRAGTLVPLRTLSELTTKGKRLRAGERFNMEVAETIMLDGQVVIPAGSPAVGEVTSVRNKGMWGKSGNIDARILYVRVGDRQLRLSGTINDKGVTGTAGVIGAIAFVPIAGFFTTGTSAVIPAGSPARGFLDEDVPVVFAPRPAPILASAPGKQELPPQPEANPAAAEASGIQPGQ